MSSSTDNFLEYLKTEKEEDAAVLISLKEVAYVFWTEEKGKRLKAIRKENKIKISDILRRLDEKNKPSSRETITALEAGRKKFVNPETILDICIEIKANVRHFLDIRIEM